MEQRAAIAVDAVVTYSCTTDSAWAFAWPLQEVQVCTTDHEFCLSCIYPQPFLLHVFLPISKASWNFPPSITSHLCETRSSAYRSSQAELVWQGLQHNDEEQGLSMDPWWTPTFASNSWLEPSPTQTWLRALAYIPWINRTIHFPTHFFLRAHQITFRGTQSNAFSRSTRMPIKASCSLLGISPAAAGPQRLHL